MTEAPRSYPGSETAPKWLKEAFYETSVPKKNIALRKAYDEIVRLRSDAQGAPRCDRCGSSGDTYVLCSGCGMPASPPYPVQSALKECASRCRYDGDMFHDQGNIERRNASWKAADMAEAALSALTSAQGSGDCDEVARLRKGIQDYLDGHYPNARDGRAEDPQHKCSHGQFYWQPCEGCIDAHFTAILAGPSASSTGGGTAA